MLLTVKQVADLVGIKPTTLYAWAQQGKIPCVKLNGLVRFSKVDIESWVETGRRTGMSVKPRMVRGSVRGDVKAYIARLRANAHNSGRGETTTKSGLIGKEETDGAI